MEEPGCLCPVCRSSGVTRDIDGPQRETPLERRRLELFPKRVSLVPLQFVQTQGSLRETHSLYLAHASIQYTEEEQDLQLSYIVRPGQGPAVDRNDRRRQAPERPQGQARQRVTAR